ncbi:putative PMR5 domain, PC-Esterase [Helianthus annuus]|nr:putative PMR5 domain, PC-Esterase [Helianthus annuus]KAJ0554346.1 putative PMR5 domain, PC-Esterase [Helianthus annuus]KAJ0719939.1 putative PMR5 domain, PC-Esterase [Helianthus annuus]KAJ0723164.1 putative PMR5 domain, PC-Esterase [Helianthus annuus]KAJ0898867.1 putative PMR5 domain, PC-Esterase [Helianthus annuus]
MKLGGDQVVNRIRALVANWVHCKRLNFGSINRFNVITSCLYIVLAVICWYVYLYEFVPPAIVDETAIVDSIDSLSKDAKDSKGVCDLYDGSWVVDETYPLYNASQCPFAEKGFNCLANGRKNKGYLKWRWKPKNCDVSRFDVEEVLEKLRGKRVVFVGDSLSRTQWESMICLLMNGVEDKTSVYEVNGNTISKKIRYLGVRFSSYNFTVEFYRSVFLVQIGSVPKRAPKRVKSTIKLDELDSISSKWIDSDILVFNTGHWWNRGKLFEIGGYFKVNGRLKLGMSIMDAYTTALNTWASWVENMVNTNRTRVFFRTFEGSHWSKSHTCKVTQKPLVRSKREYRSHFSDIIKKVVNNMSVPVTTMHVTPMGSYRSDAHVGIWGDNPTVPDCSHWCLPGVPDAWNEILFSYL